MTGLFGWLARRVAFGALTLLAVAFITFGMIRVLRPERSPGTPVISGTFDDVGRGFLHFDWGRAAAGADALRCGASSRADLPPTCG